MRPCRNTAEMWQWNIRPPGNNCLRNFLHREIMAEFHYFTVFFKFMQIVTIYEPRKHSALCQQPYTELSVSQLYKLEFVFSFLFFFTKFLQI